MDISGTLSRECIESHQIELIDNPRKAEKELGRVLIILDKHVENIQSQVLGSFYGAYTRGSIVIDLDAPTEEEKDIIITSFGKTFCEHLPRIIFSEL